MQHSNFLEEVKSQYEDYPYPMRNPEDEKRKIYDSVLSRLDAVNFFCFSGKRDFTQPIRVLIAGGGTGDSTIHIAEQLRYNESAEIIHLDFSAASIAVAKERANVRGLRNITWLQESILELPNINIDPFDYIDCSGVLHHLESPEAGLAALTSVLKEDGAMGLMLYAKYGREGVYQMQHLMRMVNEGEPDHQTQVDQCKSILASLPGSNSFRNSAFMNGQDIRVYGDIGVYDLLLHSQDRCYTVPDLYAFTESAGLKVNKLLGSLMAQGNFLYSPEAYIREPHLLAEIKQEDAVTQATIAELLHGNIDKHIFYVSRTPQALPELDNLDNVPFYGSHCEKRMYQHIRDLIAQHSGRVTIDVKVNDRESVNLNFPKTPHLEAIFKYLDGERSTRKIFDKIINGYSSKKSAPSYEHLLEEFRQAYNSLHLNNWMMLRDRSVPLIPTNEELQLRVMRNAEKAP